MAEYIDREAALKRFEEIKQSGISLKDAIYIDGVMAVIETLPAADVAPVRHGRWIDYSEPNEDGNCQCYCSNCYAGDVQRVGEKVPYCWKCGAQMGGE